MGTPAQCPAAAQRRQRTAPRAASWLIWDLRAAALLLLTEHQASSARRPATLQVRPAASRLGRCLRTPLWQRGRRQPVCRRRRRAALLRPRLPRSCRGARGTAVQAVWVSQARAPRRPMASRPLLDWSCAAQASSRVSLLAPQTGLRTSRPPPWPLRAPKKEPRPGVRRAAPLARRRCCASAVHVLGSAPPARAPRTLRPAQLTPRLRALHSMTNWRARAVPRLAWRRRISMSEGGARRRCASICAICPNSVAASLATKSAIPRRPLRNLHVANAAPLQTSRGQQLPERWTAAGRPKARARSPPPQPASGRTA